MHVHHFHPSLSRGSSMDEQQQQQQQQQLQQLQHGNSLQRPPFPLDSHAPATRPAAPFAGAPSPRPSPLVSPLVAERSLAGTEDTLSPYYSVRQEADNSIILPSPMLELPPPDLWTDDQVWEPTLFVMGGEGMRGLEHAVQSYHRNTEAWVTRPETILPRVGACCASWRETVFVFGGDEALGSAECYDIITNNWATIPPSVACLQGGTATTIDDSIYVVSGAAADGQPRCQMHRYLPLESRWEPLKVPLLARANHAAVALDGRYVVLLGGVGANGAPLLSVEAYDTLTQRWVLLPPLSTPRTRLSAVVHEGAIFALGGCSVSGDALASVEILPAGVLTEAGTVAGGLAWEAGPALLHARHSMAACSYLGRICVLGGLSPNLDLAGSDAILFLDLAVCWGVYESQGGVF
jgi:hypothetical protein